MIPAKYPRERVLRFLRKLVVAGGRRLYACTDFVLDMELAGLVIIPGHRFDAAVVQITEAGRTAAAVDGWTKPAKKIRPWIDTAQELRACPVCYGPWHGGSLCPRKI